MSTFAQWIELNESTAGWSTIVLIAWIVAAIIVGKKVMLGSTHDSWISHYIIAIGIGATVLGTAVLGCAMYLSYLLSGVAWPGLPFGVLLMLTLAFALGRVAPLGRKRHKR